MIERGKTDGEIGFYRRAGRVAGDGNRFFCVCVCLERMGASYTPHSENLAQAAASSRLHSGSPS